MSKLTPDYICIGAARCATTWVWSLFSKYSEVSLIWPKEIHFFNDNFDRGMKWYSSHFKDPNRFIRVEVDGVYFADAAAASSNMKKTCPNVNVFAILRNPFERAIDHLVFNYYRDAQTTDISIENLRSLATKHKDDKYLKGSCYGSLLLEYKKSLSAEQVALFNFEDLQNSPREFAENLLRYVGAGSEYEITDDMLTPSNSARPIRYKFLYKLLRQVKLFSDKNAYCAALISFFTKKIGASLIDKLLGPQDKKDEYPFSINEAFVELFGSDAVQLIENEMEILEREFDFPVPENWKSLTS
ncbi:sulfotransferase domain-containing protein [Maridesulfovibrio sp.]|uniref:sulfotransferase domain-containing protein n=1 Tax=Maridesulfovibrio sp. TaxID=2795000 RepID=UPI0029C9B473|nr:sulfotransferase domain-containing protein [Maridesulfovibrio sp.]